MIRLGLRLAVAGGREAAVRLVVIAVAVALGVGLLLATLAGINAVNAQNARYAWLETGYAGSTRRRHAAGDRPAVVALRADYFQGETDRPGRRRRHRARTRPVPPGIRALPGPGQYYASPALATLLRATPAAQLGRPLPRPRSARSATRRCPRPTR